MRFVFTKLFYFLIALGLIPLLLSWERPWLRYIALLYNMWLFGFAFIESRLCASSQRLR